MANDIDYATKANCKMKKVVVNGVPRLGLFALNEISKGTELRYDYGDKLAPWRKQQVGKII
jgi:SET domain-containing protein